MKDRMIGDKALIRKRVRYCTYTVVPVLFYSAGSLIYRTIQIINYSTCSLLSYQGVFRYLPNWLEVSPSLTSLTYWRVAWSMDWLKSDQKLARTQEDRWRQHGTNSIMRNRRWHMREKERRMRERMKGQEEEQSRMEKRRPPSCVSGHPPSMNVKLLIKLKGSCQSVIVMKAN